MNIHVTEEIRKKWRYLYEFEGHPFKRSNGKIYIRARCKAWPWKDRTHIYSVEDDFFWHDGTVQQLPP